MIIIMKKTNNLFFPVLKSVSFVSGLLQIASVPIGIINAKLMADVVTKATAGDYKSVLKSSLLILTILLFVKVFDLITGYIYQKKSSDSLHKCKMLLYEQYLSSPLNVLYQSTVGETNILFNSDFGTITQKYISLYPTIVAKIVMFISYLAYMCIQSPILALIMMIISFVQIIPPLFVKLFCEKLDTNTKDIEGQISNCALEFYNGFAAVKLFNLRDWCLNRMRNLHIKMWKIANKLQATYRTQTAISSIISNVLTYGTYAIVGLFIINEHITMDSGIQAIALSQSLYAASASILGLIPNFALVRNAEKRMLHYFEERDQNTKELSDDLCIKFKGISCSLGEKQIFDNANFSINSNSITVFKGVNGIGKSTIVKLALGMVDYNKGEICIGGISPKQIDYKNFPHKIFYLTQDDPAYNLTPGELFGMVLDDVGSKKAFDFLNMFNTDEQILSQTINCLSGGERKKVFLSLAFACEPQLLILDEPTNSLDRNSRDVLNKLLRSRNGGTVIITHEKELVDLASAAYVVKERQVIYEKKDI